jgi:hypothetical protein
VREDLIFLLEMMREHLQESSTGPAYNVLTQAGAGNPNLYRRYKDIAIEPRRDLYRQVLRRGIANGELRADLDVERAMLMLTSAMLTVTRHHPPPEPVGTEYSIGLADDLLRGAARHTCACHEGADCGAELERAAAEAAGRRAETG